MMTSKDLIRKLDDKPFKPFRMRMVNNQAYDVRDPGMIIVGETSAVVATRDVRDPQGHTVTTDWRTISIDHIMEFADIEEKPSMGRRKRA
jgi:hypothetical protein